MLQVALGRHLSVMTKQNSPFFTAGQLPRDQRDRLAHAMDLHQRGQTGAAETLYRLILSAFPTCIDALHFHGLAATQRGALDEGIAMLRQAVALHPAASVIQCNLARALIDRREPAGAIACCDAVIAREPNNANAWFLRGNALQLADAHEHAVLSYDRALRHAPSFPAALNNQAHSLRMLRRPAAALRVLARALWCQPIYAMALNNQGLALLDLDRAAEALNSFEAALAAQANLMEALANRGVALLRLKRFAEAGDAFERLETLAPGFEGAVGNLLFARRNCCDWAAADRLGNRLIESVERGELADMPLSFLYVSDSPRLQLACAWAFVQSRYPAQTASAAGRRPDDQPRIRIAYLSGDFGEHAVSHLLAAVIERHDRDRFDILGIGWGRQNEGPMRRRLEAAFDRFVDATQLPDFKIATLLRELEVDIAVDLMGHTQGQRTGIFAHRGAPVQVGYLGYPGTSGAPYLDYLIGDPVVIPAGDEVSYSERVVRLPHCYLPTDDRRSIDGESITRQAAGLPRSGFVFCVFNSPAKFTRPMFDTWLKLLRQTPESVLWLRTPVADARSNLLREAISAGVEPERLVFAEALESIEAHLARHRLADLFLDTLPYNAHTTACDALWAGLPVLTCRGRSFAGRVGASLLTALGLPELVADSLEDYESKALYLARHPHNMVSLREKLAVLRGTSPLFDTARYTRHLESAYTAMSTRYRDGLPPAALCIEACSQQ
jgi:predicted O-linked N-acetylglucosamine transferase (SPINDLY family)